MKFIIATTITLLLSTATIAQTMENPGEILTVDMRGYCYTNSNSYFLDRDQRYGELPLLLANGQSIVMYENKELDSPGVLVVLSNQDTRTVSIAMAYPDGVVCEILTGTNFEPYSK